MCIPHHSTTINVCRYVARGLSPMPNVDHYMQHELAAIHQVTLTTHALPCTTHHYITWACQYTTSPQLNYQFITVHCTTLLIMALISITIQCIPFHRTALNVITIRYTASHYTTLKCHNVVSLPLHYIAPHVAVLDRHTSY